MTGSRRGRLGVLVAVWMVAALAVGVPGAGAGSGRPMAGRAEFERGPRPPVGDPPAVRSPADELLAASATAGGGRPVARPASGWATAGHGPAERPPGRAGSDGGGQADARRHQGRSPPPAAT